jgi:hypothetical protein
MQNYQKPFFGCSIKHLKLIYNYISNVLMYKSNFTVSYCSNVSKFSFAKSEGVF